MGRFRAADGRAGILSVNAELIDARGLNCPMPLLKARKALAGKRAGERIEVLATDAGAEADFKAYCEHSGHRLITIKKSGDEYSIVVERGA